MDCSWGVMPDCSEDSGRSAGRFERIVRVAALSAGGREAVASWEI